VTADEINAAVASAGVSGSAGASTAAAAATPTAATPATKSTATAASNAGAAATAAASTTSSTPATSSLDLGSCAGSSPFIVFGAGFDGRNEDSFEPADESEFNHGSALNIGVVADFICGQLGSKCQASQATVDACNAGTTAATASGVSGQAAADAFNNALQ
jgi:hypothetical protein